MFEVCVEATFAAAHQLRNYKGKCENLHGHNYKVRVTVAGEKLNSTGLVADFGEVKAALRDIVRRLDHRFLNELEPFIELNPSAENIALYFYQELDKGLRELVREKYPDVEIQTVRDPAGPLSAGAVDLVVLSAQPAITAEIPAQEFKQSLLDQVQRIKQELNAHVIVYNCSSVDPDDKVYNYRGIPDTFQIRVHRANLVLMQISQLEGISIIDVERIVGQLAGDKVVKGPLDYTDEGYAAMGREFLRVLEDIGFFENRPLVMQIGQAMATR